MQFNLTKLFKVTFFLTLSFMLLLVPLFNVTKDTSPSKMNMMENNSHHFLYKIHPFVLSSMLTNPDDTIQVIISKNEESSAFDKQLNLLGKQIEKFDFIHASVIEIKKTNIMKLAKLPNVNFIVLNQKTSLANRDITKAIDYSNVSVSFPFAVQAEKVWEHGIDGSGVTVAVVDSGISDLDGQFDNRLLSNIEFNSNSNTTKDEYGHGTHVASIIGGNGAASRGKFLGIAPGVNILNVKFSTRDGSGSEADLVRALQWIYENKEKYNIRVTNISSSIDAIQSYKDSAVAAAVEQLWFAGIVVVVSAGNDGDERCSTCHAPANDPYVITVGAIDDLGTKGLRDDVFKSWSSRGYTIDGHKKPEVLAPGVNIISYMPTGYLRKVASDQVVSGKYFRMSGTSMSAPVVSGVVALMLQANPHLSPDQVKWILTHTTRQYMNQHDRSPGIINAPHAVFYNGAIGKANQHLEPSPFINQATNRILYNNMSWSNMSWSNMSWSNHIR